MGSITLAIFGVDGTVLSLKIIELPDSEAGKSSYYIGNVVQCKIYTIDNSEKIIHENSDNKKVYRFDINNGIATIAELDLNDQLRKQLSDQPVEKQINNNLDKGNGESSKPNNSSIEYKWLPQEEKKEQKQEKPYYVSYFGYEMKL